MGATSRVYVGADCWSGDCARTCNDAVAAQAATVIAMTVLPLMEIPRLLSYLHQRAEDLVTIRRTRSGNSCNDTIPPAGFRAANRIASSGSFIISTGCTPAAL